MLLLENIAQLVTPIASPQRRGESPRSYGPDMGTIELLENVDCLIDGETIAEIAPTGTLTTPHDNAERFDCSNCVLLPGYVDSHTHLVFAGNRSHEFAMRLRGASYQEIYEAGGGIRSTMRSVREASLEEIVERARPLMESAFAHGSTTIEVKSGYGLDTASELKLLEAVRLLDREDGPDLVPTFLGAHAFPPEFAEDRAGYIDLLVNEMIPEVADRGLAEYCDVFTDEGYFTVEESITILEAGREHGMKVRVHADELADVSAAAMAASVGAVSADHLLMISEEGIDAMEQAGVIATLLPGTAFYLGLPYAPARRLMERGLAVALASDCNPGTNMCENMGMTMALASMGMKMTIEESITAATLNGAAALDRSEAIGRIEPGMQADLQILDIPSYPDLVYHYGVNHVRAVVKKGELHPVR